MEESLVVAEYCQVNKYENRLINSDSGDMQQSSSVYANGESNFDPRKNGNGVVHVIDDKVRIEERLECLSTKAGRDSEQEPELAQSSSRSKLDRKDEAVEWGIDKTLPPIKTRRDNDESHECSPSDLSPPSPKRMRQGSKERTEDRLENLWNDADDDPQ